ncbi:hypothetical protein HIM_05108 [Hirsutella minnesotensis 3608]|uniref:Tyrosinase copper-binding domain-containing protein n=1 Tax=Hirsutella minnesotensis 3608 TaxID=1043627 RepID=A0A0F8A0K4_9HYPO|nr:hypothetical protein HIM_05108 [Hirsutella minnesotensis 3608]
MLGHWISALLPLASLLGSSYASEYGDLGGIDSPQAFKDFEAKYASSMNELLQHRPRNCTKANVAIRRSWESMSKKERLDYIRAIKCLHKKPTRGNLALSPGNENRLDDFTSSHINSSLYIHQSGFFLPWHRYFVWSFEKALREECDYRGYQPYWDFARWSDDQLDSPLFDGSSTSLGGDGEDIGESAKFLDIPGIPVKANFTVPAGTGGGCVTSGPFAPFNVSLGPVTPGHPPTPGDTFGLQYNPRCLTRSFIPAVSKQYLTWDVLVDLLQSHDIHRFRPLFEDGNGIHPMTHAAIGGLALDFFASPGDPVFYFLHGQLDRIWALWQGQNWHERRDALDGTETFQNLVPSPNVTLDTPMNMYYAGGKIPVRNAMSTIDGPFCYIYE